MFCAIQSSAGKEIEKCFTVVSFCGKCWGELDCNDVGVQFSHEWKKQENQTGKILEEIKWKQNRNWLRCLGGMGFFAAVQQASGYKE